MINRGAYSKKYQAIERGKMRDIKEQEKKINRERTQVFSIQTTQRQRALEEKKRAMVEAEEERRRKVLEERRRSQRQATERFRAAISQFKSSSKTSVVPGKVKLKGIRCSHPQQAQNNTPPLEIESQVKHSNDNRPVEGLSLGKDVEILPDKFFLPHNLQKKALSLDDVLDKIKGESDTLCDTPNVSPTVTTSSLSGLQSKSASDTNLSVLAWTKSVNEAQSSSDLKEENRNSVTVDCEDVIFKHVEKTPMSVQEKTPVETLENSDDGSSSNENDLAIPDSLNSSCTESISPMKHDEDSTGKTKESSETLSYTTNTEVFEPLRGSQTICSTSASSKHIPQSATPSPGPSKTKLVSILKKNSASFSENHRNRSVYRKSNDSASLSSMESSNSSKIQKRVRFDDQVDTTKKNNPAIADPVQIELWKRIFPNSPSIPNSAFTPKMKCSLASKAAPSQGVSQVSKRFVPPEYALPSRPTLDDSGIDNSEDDSNKIDSNARKTELDQTLDKTPTDSDIDNMWEQIRLCFKDKKVSLPPRVFNFKPASEDVGDTYKINRGNAGDTHKANRGISDSSKDLTNTGSKRINSYHATPRQLVYRQNRPPRYHSDLPSYSATATPTRQEQLISDHFQPQMQSAAKSSSGAKTNLSLEEDQLMQSIERLDQRFKDHTLGPMLPNSLAPQTHSEYTTNFHYPVPPHAPPPKHAHPSTISVRSRGLTEQGSKVTPANFRARTHNIQPPHRPRPPFS